MHQLNRIRIHLTLLVLGVLLAFVGINTAIYIKHFRFSADASENLAATINLIQHNTISLDGLYDNNNLKPTSLREPLPIFINAIWVKGNHHLSQLSTLDEYLMPENAIHFSMLNVTYIILICLGVYLLSYTIFAKRFRYWSAVLLAFSTMLLAYSCLPFIQLNTLLTEFFAEMLIIFFILCWHQSFETKKPIYYVLSGVFLGCLLLTKAAFVYIANFTFLLVAIYLLKFDKRYLSKNILIIAIANLMVLPWYIRNYVEFNEWAYTGRGASVLLSRAYFDRMSDDEYIGAFYAYAPHSLKSTISKLTGFNYNDRFEGGRLERFKRYPAGDMQYLKEGNEQAAVSYIVKSWIHRGNILKEVESLHYDSRHTRKLANKQISAEAKAIIVKNFWKHLKATLLFGWRGSWPSNRIDGVWHHRLSPVANWKEITSFMGLLSMFLLLFSGLAQKNNEILCLSILGVVQFSFYAFFTHFLPRYSEMFVAIWVTCFVVFSVLIIKKLFRKKLLSDVELIRD